MSGPTVPEGPWDVVVIGPGRVGAALAVALATTRHRVAAVAGGGAEDRRAVVRHVRDAGGGDVRAVDDPAAVVAGAELLLVTTPDDVVEPLVTGLAAADLLGERHRVVHTSGAQGLAPLRHAALAGAGVAACHPAQTVPGGPPDPTRLRDVPWAVTAAPADLDWADALVEDLGGRPHRVRGEDRVLYHAALTVASNTVGAAVVLARRLLLGARVEDAAGFLAPLVAASVDNVLAGGAEALTGPVVRGDIGTVTRHLAALDADVPELAGPYRALTRAVLDQVRPALEPEVAARLEALLERRGGGSGAGEPAGGPPDTD